MTEDKMNSSIFIAIVSLAGIVGFILGFIISRNRQQSMTITEFTRDDAGRILSILEKIK